MKLLFLYCFISNFQISFFLDLFFSIFIILKYFLIKKQFYIKVKVSLILN